MFWGFFSQSPLKMSGKERDASKKQKNWGIDWTNQGPDFITPPWRAAILGQPVRRREKPLVLFFILNYYRSVRLKISANSALLKEASSGDSWSWIFFWPSLFLVGTK